MVKRPLFEDREAYLAGLVELNQKAKAEPEVVDLLEAYARLKLRDGQPFDLDPDALPERSSADTFSLSDFATKNPGLDEQALAFIGAYASEVEKRRLPVLLSVDHLASALGLTPLELRHLRRSRQRYRVFTIPKRDGSARSMAEPNPRLKKAQRWIKREILDRVALHPRVHGFRRHRSIATNAVPHVGKAVVIKLDLEDFFPSITAGRIFGLFLTLGFPRGVADALTDLTAFVGAAPIGAPTSPGLANIVARRLDHRLHNLGRKERFSYTRYADDLTISSNRKDLSRLIPLLREIISGEGFTLNAEKLRVVRASEQQRVTGVVVNETRGLGREQQRLLRAVIHNCRHGNLDAQRRAWAQHIGAENPDAYSINQLRASLLGHVAFLAMVNPELGRKLRASFDEIPFGQRGP